MDQTLELSVWLGIAGVALVCARILLWRTRRILSRSRHEARVPEVRHAPASVTKLAS
jgi:nitrate reductase gamma subunit